MDYWPLTAGDSLSGTDWTKTEVLCRTFKFFMDYEEAIWKSRPDLNLLLRTDCNEVSCLVWLGESFVLFF